jgi:hypothetical protein
MIHGDWLPAGDRAKTGTVAYDDVPLALFSRDGIEMEWKNQPANAGLRPIQT